MRQRLRAGLVGLSLAVLPIGTARAQWPEAPVGPPSIQVGPAIPFGPPPAFSSPMGGGQGYGYAPSAFWVRPGFQLQTFYGITVSSPYRPGSLQANLPTYGDFSTGDGPYVFPPRFHR